MIKKYTHRPLEVHAIQWTSKNLQIILEFVEAIEYQVLKDGHLDWMLQLWQTKFSPTIYVGLRDYIILDDEGNVFVMTPYVFGQLYEESNE